MAQLGRTENRKEGRGGRGTCTHGTKGEAPFSIMTYSIWSQAPDMAWIRSRLAQD